MSSKETMVFFRKIEGKDYYYSIYFLLPEDSTIFEAAKAHAESNPGTIRVEDIKGNLLWPLN